MNRNLFTPSILSLVFLASGASALASGCMSPSDSYSPGDIIETHAEKVTYVCVNPTVAPHPTLCGFVDSQGKRYGKNGPAFTWGLPANGAELTVELTIRKVTHTVYDGCGDSDSYDAPELQHRSFEYSGREYSGISAK